MHFNLSQAMKSLEFLESEVTELLDYRLTSAAKSCTRVHYRCGLQGSNLTRLYPVNLGFIGFIWIFSSGSAQSCQLMPFCGFWGIHHGSHKLISSPLLAVSNSEAQVWTEVMNRNRSTNSLRSVHRVENLLRLLPTFRWIAAYQLLRVYFIGASQNAIELSLKCEGIAPKCHRIVHKMQ